MFPYQTIKFSRIIGRLRNSDSCSFARIRG